MHGAGLTGDVHDGSTLDLTLGTNVRVLRVSSSSSSRWLSIGEFASATQLSPKALRMYDEQQLLPPARIEPNGYRYYRSEQVARGRLIRTLRDMGLSLAEVGSVVGVAPVRAQRLLAELAQEQERRHALAKRSFQTALAMLRSSSSTDAPTIVERIRAPLVAASCEFTSNRYEFIERFRKEALAAETQLSRAGIRVVGEASCVLLDPLSDDEGRMEAMIPIVAPAPLPPGLTLKELPTAHCAAMTIGNRRTHASDIVGALDAVFDWFDRCGYRASGAPLFSIADRGDGLQTEILWAYERNAGDHA